MDAEIAPEDISSIIVLPDDAAQQIRGLLGLGRADELRISYITGPGDVQGTYEYWLEGKLDPRVPTVAKSAMYYELCRRIGARAQLIADAQPNRSAYSDGAVQFDYIERRRFSGAVSYHRASALRVLDARRAIKEFSPHFVVACTDFPVYGLPVLKSRGTKLIFSLHNTFWTKGQTKFGPKERFNNWTRRHWLKSVDAALCTSLECERQFRQLTDDKILALRNIPQQRTPSSVRPAPRAVKKRKILYLGRIEHAKGVFDLLAAYKALHPQYQDIELIFAGDGAALGALEEAVSSFNDPNVRCIGRLSADRVFAELQETHVVICPTRNAFKEGLALVCIEAAVYGVPSIMSTAVPAAYLLPESGAVFEADSVSDLAASIDELLRDPQLRERRSESALKESQQFFQRDKSWGSYLYQAMCEAASR